LVLAALALAGLFAAGWHYSELILGPDRRPARRGQSVLARTDSTLTLAASPKALRPGRWAIEWEGGYGELGPVLRADSGRVVRPFRLASGAPPETTARLGGFAFDADPGTWLGVPFESVTYRSSLGPIPAWLVPGADSTWAIFVHGRAASRAEMLRMLPPYRALGLTCLVICYRNDRCGPRALGGHYQMGATEWHDLEDAVRFALEHGARRVVPVGCSMGGSTVAEFLRHSPLAARAPVAVLDAPALDWNAMFAVAARQRHVPPWLTAIGKAIATLRTGIRWSELEQARHAAEFRTPILILHGARDPTAPMESSRRFAAARPDLVTFAAFTEAGHVEATNFEEARYRTLIAGWLLAHGVGREAPAPASRTPALSARSPRIRAAAPCRAMSAASRAAPG
jgi:pimeloyl-ACP methyl ester carboxylesterase